MLQEQYAEEGIDWSYVEFVDNQECLDLLEGSPVNPTQAVFPLIDEACRMPRATYQVEKSLVRQAVGGMPRLESPEALQCRSACGKINNKSIGSASHCKTSACTSGYLVAPVGLQSSPDVATALLLLQFSS